MPRASGGGGTAGGSYRHRRCGSSPSLHPIALDESPIGVEPEAGLVADVDVAVAQLGVLAEEAIGERVAVAPAMRLDPEGAARQGEDEMAVDLGCGMGRDHDPVLFGE